MVGFVVKSNLHTYFTYQKKDKAFIFSYKYLTLSTTPNTSNPLYILSKREYSLWKGIPPSVVVTSSSRVYPLQ